MGNILNIFTDASVKHNRTKTFTVGCPGFTVFINNLMILPVTYQFILDSTNNESEILAIFNALYYVLCNKNVFTDIDTINIFSDSKISVYGLREWYKKWIINFKEDLMYSSSGKPVANQRFFIECMGIIDALNKKVNIYHVNGHIDLWDKKSINKFITTFVRENQPNRELSKDEMDFIIDGNNRVDERTGIVDRYQIENIDINSVRRFNKDNTLFKLPEIIKSINFNNYNSLISDYRNIHLF